MAGNHQRTAWAIATLMLVLCGIVTWLATRRGQSLPTVQAVNRPFSAPIALRDRLGRWVPQGGAWIWANRLEDAVFGRRKPLNFNQQIFALDHVPATNVLQLGSGLRPSSGSAWQIWFLDNLNLKALRARLGPIIDRDSSYRSRVSTAEGIGASIFVGESILLHGLTNQVGQASDYYARVRKDGIDLFASVQLSQLETNDVRTIQGPLPLISIHTNLDFAARIQLPKGFGFFILTDSTEPGQKCLGVMVDAP